MSPTGTDAAIVLRAACDRAYETFAPYPARAEMPRCQHCVTSFDVRRLISLPLRDTPAEALESYAWKAITTWGDIDDFRHVLPRLLELVAEHQPVPSPTVLASKLRTAGWTEWPPPERAAVDDYLEALWLATLARDPAFVSVAELLGAIATARDDVQPYLDDWHLLLGSTGPERTAAARHLVTFIRRAGPLLDAGGSLAPLVPEPGATAVREWLLSAEVASVLSALSADRSTARAPGTDA